MATKKKSVSRARTRKSSGITSGMRSGKIRTSETVRVDTSDLIALICKAASERWPEDKSRPGVQVAHLPGLVGGSEETLYSASWYVALHRYTDVMGQGRIVQFKIEHEDLDLALLYVARYLATPDEARRELARVIK